DDVAGDLFPIRKQPAKPGDAPGDDAHHPQRDRHGQDLKEWGVEVHQSHRPGHYDQEGCVERWVIRPQQAADGKRRLFGQDRQAWFHRLQTTSISGLTCASLPLIPGAPGSPAITSPAMPSPAMTSPAMTSPAITSPTSHSGWPARAASSS